jgi:hypothetical protein
MMSAVGVSELRPTATTFALRSRSVTVPMSLCPSTATKTDETRSRAISSAASLMVEPTGTTSGARRTNADTCVAQASTASRSGPFEHGDLATPETAGEEGETASSGHDLEGDVPVDEIADRVLGRAEREGGLEPGEQGDEPEQLALPEHVGHELPLHGLDRAGANDVQERARLSRLVLDHRPGGEELDVGVPNDLGQPLFVQLVEGRIQPEE